MSNRLKGQKSSPAALFSRNQTRELRAIVTEAIDLALEGEQDRPAFFIVNNEPTPADVLIADRWQLMKREVSAYLKGELTFDAVVSRWGEHNAETQWTAIVTIAQFVSFFSPDELHPTAVYKLAIPAPKSKKGGK